MKRSSGFKIIGGRPSVQDVFDEVDSVLGEETALWRSVKMFLCQRYTWEKLKDIGRYFDIGESGVSQASRCVHGKMENDKKLRRKIAQIEKRLNVSRMKTWPHFLQKLRFFVLRGKKPLELHAIWEAFLWAEEGVGKML
jgi:hypothetical protein